MRGTVGGVKTLMALGLIAVAAACGDANNVDEGARRACATFRQTVETANGPGLSRAGVAIRIEAMRDAASESDEVQLEALALLMEQAAAASAVDGLAVYVEDFDAECDELGL